MGVVKSYLVVQDDNLDNLVEIINNLIKNGWVPKGGISFLQTNSNHVTYLQSMVRA